MAHHPDGVIVGVMRSADQAEFAAGCDCLLAGIDPELAVDDSGVAARRSRPPATACRRATAPSGGAVRPPPATGPAQPGLRRPARSRPRAGPGPGRPRLLPGTSASSQDCTVASRQSRHSRSNATAPRVRKFLTPLQGHSRPSHFPRAALTLPRLQATPTTAYPLAITDEASPFALRSTRNRQRTAMHRRCPHSGRGLLGRWCRCSCQGRSQSGPCQRFARNCATRSLTSPHDPTLGSAFHLLGCVGT